MNEESMRDGTNRGETNRGEESFSASLKWQAGKNETIARNLSREAMAQWQKAINGVLAMPAALALTAAANSLFIAAFIERGFEVFQSSAEAMGRELQTRVQDQLRDSGNRGGNQNRSAQTHS